MRQVLPLICHHAFSLGIGILGIKLVSSWVPPQLYIQYTLFLTLTTVGSLLTHSGLTNHLIRYWQREAGQRRAYAGFIWHQGWWLSLPLAGLLLGICVLRFSWDGLAQWLWVFPLLWLGNLGYTAWMMAGTALNAQERNWWFCLLGSLCNAGRSLLPVGMVWVGGATLMALCGGFTLYALLALAITGVLYAGLGFKQAPAVEKRQVWRKELQEFGRPFIWIGIGGWLVQYADRWIVDFFFSGHQAGLYSLAVNMASFVPAMAGSVLLQWIFPRFFRQADQARNGDDWRVLARRCDRIAFAFMGISVAGLGVLWAMGPYLVPWLIDSQYLEAMPLLFSAGLAMAVVPMNQFHYLLLQCQHDSLNIAKTMLIVAAFKLIGTVVAAWFSWSVFLMWLVASFFACAFLGRFLVWRLALRGGCAVTDRVKD